MKTEMKSAPVTRQKKEDSAAYLTRRVRQIVSDCVKGKFNHQRQANEPGTGHPWVQTKLIRVDGILGWSAIDAYDDRNVEFAELTEETVRMAHGLHRGVFATTEPLSRDKLRAEYLTNHVTAVGSLDRLKADLSEKFDLSLFFLWDETEITLSIEPNCRKHEKMTVATVDGVQCVVHRIGTENDLRHAARSGIDLKNGDTRFLHRLSKEYILYLEDRGRRFIERFLKKTFDNGVTWGWENPLHSDREALDGQMDMSKLFQGNGSPLLPFEDMEEDGDDPAAETVVLTEEVTTGAGELVLV